MNKWKRRSPLIGACAAIAVLALLLVIYSATGPVPMAGTKSISIDVVYEDGSMDHYKITTEARFLSDALKSIPDLKIEGTTSEEEGLLVTSINGREADMKKGKAYWELLCDGEPASYGVSMQAIKDGETYTFQYTKIQKKSDKT